MKENLTRRDFLKASGGALAGAYVLGLAGCSREQSGGQVQAEAADFQASAGRPLRIMSWNIAEGRYKDDPRDAELPRIAEQIRAQSPDIVLLNEAVIWIPGCGVNQVIDLATRTGLQYYHWGWTRKLTEFCWSPTPVWGEIGVKVVAILSRYWLSNPVVHSGPRSFNTLEVTASIDSVPHRIFSTRFSPRHNPEMEADNIEGHRQAIDLLRRFDWGTPIIFGGDFNAKMTCSQFTNFVDNSGLANAFVEYQEHLEDPCVARPVDIVCHNKEPEGPIDHIFYCGPYRVTRMEVRCPWPGGDLSDHPWYLVELSKVDTAPLRGYRSLESLNHPTRFVRHAWSLGELTEIHSDLDRQDATFKIVPGLADDRFVSFESVNYPNHFLRHQDSRLKLHPRSEQWLFKADATFLPIGGLADAAATSFRSYNYPARHLRHRDLHMWVERGGGDYFNDHANDATFRVVDPLWPLSDTTPPDTTIDSGPSGTVWSSSATFTFSSNEPDATFECSLDGADYSSCTSPKRYADLSGREHTFSVRAIDGVGNIDPTPASRSWRIERDPCPRPDEGDCP